MKDQALQIVREQGQELDKLNYLREYLQHLILREMFERGFLQKLIYHGGTALRMIYELPRFSEDLDFHLFVPQLEYSPDEAVGALKTALERNGYQVEFKTAYSSNVKKIMIKFGSILYEAGISQHKERKLNIKLEIDVNPPAGFVVEKRVIDRYFPFVVHHHNESCFFAGKLHAIMQRRWTKGRDFFDLNFILNRWKDVIPDFNFLNSSLRRTGYGRKVTADNWRNVIIRRVKETNWKTLVQDVAPFVLRRGDLKTFEKDLIIAKLREGKAFAK
ncbi:nucleotidyl transferase AbiEii/AbiGii toxin family protein [bacterium]|nr:nucleotidyl transferase AbiEii/AbiGii toxin family protein [bacterium]MBU3955421.1 nucleotidyl transferase AbiEii/AbiGii toxin family protein [bacterium]